MKGSTGIQHTLEDSTAGVERQAQAAGTRQGRSAAAQPGGLHSRKKPPHPRRSGMPNVEMGFQKHGTLFPSSAPIKGMKGPSLPKPA